MMFAFARRGLCFGAGWMLGLVRAGVGAPRERGWGGGASREGPRRAVITPHERQYHVGFLLQLSRVLIYLSVTGPHSFVGKHAR